jgi:hypothetical protein
VKLHTRLAVALVLGIVLGAVLHPYFDNAALMTLSVSVLRPIGQITSAEQSYCFGEPSRAAFHVQPHHEAVAVTAIGPLHDLRSSPCHLALALNGHSSHLAYSCAAAPAIHTG